MSPLKAERDALLRKIYEDDKWISETTTRFFRMGGSCCPACGRVPGYSERLIKRERREARLSQIEAKLRKDDRCWQWPRRITIAEFMREMSRKIAKAFSGR